MPRRYVIVGTGAAGLAAAETIRSREPACDVALVSEDPHGYYSRPGLAYYLTGEVPERMLHPLSAEEWRRRNLRLVRAHVSRLDPAAHRVELDTGESLDYDGLLLATGSQATPAAAPGADLAGVVKLDDLEDARRILKLSRSASAAVVVGGGITALEVVEGLHARHVHTHYFLRKDRYWSNVLDQTESRLVERRLQKEGVEIHYNTDLAQIQGKGGRVVGVTTADGRDIPCGLVAVAIGVRPRMELAVAAGLKTQRGILVDQYLQTSAADVFAAGDVAQVFDPASGKAVMNTLWGVAVAQGRTAGVNMTGQVQPYRAGVPINVTRLAWLTTTIIGTVGRGRDEDVPGLNRGDSEAWRQLAEAAQGTGPVSVERMSGANRLRVVAGEKTLLGAIVMGDQAVSRPLYDLIGQQADISPIRDRLLDAAASLEDVLAEFWEQWRKVRAAQEP
jgi:NADPH-dependent 2,4-dienoyl-CoA reductase/sulfur reductase-like enzyme